MVPPSVLPEAHFPGGGDGIAAVREENVFSVVVPPPASVTVGLVAAVSLALNVVVAEAKAGVFQSRGLSRFVALPKRGVKILGLRA